MTLAIEMETQLAALAASSQAFLQASHLSFHPLLNRSPKLSPGQRVSVDVRATDWTGGDNTP